MILFNNFNHQQNHSEFYQARALKPTPGK